MWKRVVGTLFLIGAITILIYAWMGRSRYTSLLPLPKASGEQLEALPEVVPIVEGAPIELPEAAVDPTGEPAVEPAAEEAAVAPEQPEEPAATPPIR